MFQQQCTNCGGDFSSEVDSAPFPVNNVQRKKGERCQSGDEKEQIQEHHQR